MSPMDLLKRIAQDLRGDEDFPYTSNVDSLRTRLESLGGSSLIADKQAQYAMDTHEGRFHPSEKMMAVNWAMDSATCFNFAEDTDFSRNALYEDCIDIHRRYLLAKLDELLEQQGRPDRVKTMTDIERDLGV